jgi:hypothetical protein
VAKDRKSAKAAQPWNRLKGHGHVTVLDYVAVDDQEILKSVV